MLLPSNKDYSWVHEQHEKWNEVTKEKLRYLDQVIDGHLEWYTTHKTASDVIRTRRALPDPSFSSRRSKKRKLSDIEESQPITEDVYVDEDIPTDKQNEEEEERDKRKRKDEEEKEVEEEKEKEAEEADEEDEEDEEKEKEVEEDEEKENSQLNENKTDLNEDNSAPDTVDTLKNSDKDTANDDDQTSQEDEPSEMTSGNHNNPTIQNYEGLKVVSSIHIGSSILNKSTKPAKSGFISRLLSLKNKSSPSTPNETAQSRDKDTDKSDNTHTVETTGTITETAVETQNNAIDNTASNQVEYPEPTANENEIVVSEVVPEPRPRFQSKKKKVQEKEKEIEHVKETVEMTEISGEGNTTFSSTATTESNKTKVIREIDDDAEEHPLETEEVKKTPVKKASPPVPAWAKGPGLEKHLKKQMRLDPERIFGPIAPIKLKDIFQKKCQETK